MSNEHYETLFDLCQPSLDGESDHTAVEHYSSDEKCGLVYKSITYKQLKRIVDQVSDVIVKCTKAFHVIGICLEPSIELVVTILSILKIKKVFFPLGMKCKSPITTDLSHMMTITTMRYILSSSANSLLLLDCLQHCQCEVKIVAEIECVAGNENLILIEATSDENASNLDWTNLAYIIRTSGTTGIPKIIAVPNSCIVPNILHLSSMFGVQSASKVALMSPPTFDPSIVELFMALHNCATIVIPSTRIKAQPCILVDVLINKGRVTVLQATPSVISKFSTNILRNHIFCDTSSLDVMAFGGEACPSYKTIQSWLNQQNVLSGKLPNKFFNVYGISEVSSWASCHMLHPDKILNCSSLPVSLGCPLLKTQLQIRNESTDDVLCQIDGEEIVAEVKSSSNEISVKKCKFTHDELDIHGKLYIGGKHRCCHIIGQENVEYHDSGDIVKIAFGRSGDGPILKYIGRADSTVKRNGKKLNLHHLAQKVTDIDDVRLCHAVGITSRQNLVKVVAFLVRDRVDVPEQDGAEIFTSKNSKMWTFDVFKKLLTYMDVSQLPDHILEISCLPVNSHGKVDEKSLKHILCNQNITGTYDIDNVFLREIMTLILTSVLKDCMSSTHNTKEFLDFNKTLINLGGDSFAATLLVNWLEVFLNVDLFGIFPDIFETVLSSSLNEVIEKLSDTTLRNCHVGVSKRGCKRKLAIVEYDWNNRTESRFPLPISRGMNVKYSQYSNQHTCGCSFSGNSSNNVKPSVSQLWKLNTGKCIDASPLVYLIKENEGLIYIGSHSHRFCCVDLHGKIVWNVTLSNRIESSACICTIDGEEYVAVGCYDYKIYTLHARTGEIHWVFQTGAEVKSSPCWSEILRLLYCGSHDGYLYALDIKEKVCRWKFYCHGGAVYSSPNLVNIKGDGCLAFGATLQGRVICCYGQTGEERWNYQIKKPIFSSPCVDEAAIYIGCVGGQLYSLSFNGDLNWTFGTGSSIFSSPSISSCQSGVLVGSHDGFLYKVSKKDGSLLWKTMMSSDRCAVYSTPFQVEGVVVSTATNGSICLLDDGRGDMLWQTKLPGEVFSSPVALVRCDTLQDNLSIAIYIGCRDDNLYCLEASGI